MDFPSKYYIAFKKKGWSLNFYKSHGHCPFVCAVPCVRYSVCAVQYIEMAQGHEHAGPAHNSRSCVERRHLEIRANFHPPQETLKAPWKMIIYSKMVQIPIGRRR